MAISEHAFILGGHLRPLRSLHQPRWPQCVHRWRRAAGKGHAAFIHFISSAVARLSFMCTRRRLLHSASARRAQLMLHVHARVCVSAIGEAAGPTSPCPKLPAYIARVAAARAGRPVFRFSGPRGAACLASLHPLPPSPHRSTGPPRLSPSCVLKPKSTSRADLMLKPVMCPTTSVTAPSARTSPSR